MKLSAEANHFPENLKNKVTDEPFFWFFTPKVFNDKPFTGKVDQSTFDLSLNSYFKSFKYMRIRGSYKKKLEDLYYIEYDIDIPKGIKIFSLIIYIFSFSFINIMIYQDTGKIEEFPNIIALAFLLWYFLVNTILKIKNKKKFVNEFNLKKITIAN